MDTELYLYLGNNGPRKIMKQWNYHDILLSGNMMEYGWDRDAFVGIAV